MLVVGCPVQKVPLKIGVLLPAHGTVRVPTVVKYILENKSNQLIQLDVGIDASEGFMFAGFKQVPYTFPIYSV